MRHLYTIGEIVYDLIFRNDKPVSGTPGGAMLNTSVTLGRLGIPVRFISEAGRDKIGEIVLSFLQQNSISTHLIQREEKSKTALALAFLDDANNANYDFYKHYPHTDFIIPIPDFHHGDFFLFGSFFALTKRYIQSLKDITGAARKAGTLIFYDPNFRKTHLSELKELKPLIMENIASADIIRGSDEDFKTIFGVENPEEVWKVINNPEKILIHSASQKGVTLLTHKFRKEYTVHKIIPVSTIGAGDNFNAGIIHSLYQNKISRKNILNLSIRDWDNIIVSGVAFGTMACLTMENYLTKEEVDRFLI